MGILLVQDNSRVRDILKVELYFCEYGLYHELIY